MNHYSHLLRPMSFRELCRELRWIKNAEDLIDELGAEREREESQHAIAVLSDAVNSARQALSLPQCATRA